MNFADLECEGSSELYKSLSLQVAEDELLLKLALQAKKGQPIPNLFFGAVHYLLLKGTDHELTQFYPSITNQVNNTDNPFPLFKDFCLRNREEIIPLLQNKLVQTNEVRRCTYLYPIFCYITEQTKKPLSLIEIGCSAGLQLLWDQYAYSYGSKQTFGKSDSRVHLSSEIRKGTLSSQVLNQTPQVADRIGVDLHISDLTNKEDYDWLKALIWPEHVERLKNFENAASQLQLNPPSMVEGDGVALLQSLVEDMSQDTTLCIFHTHVANQMTEEVKKELMKNIAEISTKRNVFHIYNNIHDRQVHIDKIIQKKITRKTIGHTDGHARWFDWNIKEGT